MGNPTHRKLAILPIVEGGAEVESVPVLLRRVLEHLRIYDVSVARPFRVSRNKVVKEGEIERAIKQSIRDRGNVCSVIVLLDADDDCPATLGPDLSRRCREETHLPVAVVLAKKELEAWFLGAKESLRGIKGIRPDASSPSDPESIQGAKEHLSKNMMNGMRYLSRDNQPAFAKQMDLELARQRCPSFNKFLRDVGNLLPKRN